MEIESLNFDTMTKLYDRTRTFDRKCFESAVDYIVNRFPPHIYNRLFEPGIGTGRIAIPFAERGYRVWGVDIAGDMLAVLRQKLLQYPLKLHVVAENASVLELPFKDGEFDIAVVSHLFYFIRQWQKAVEEILRVLKHDGPLIFMHTGGGTEVPSLNNRYKELCAGQGYVIPDIGVKSTAEVTGYLSGLGCKVEPVQDQWTWTTHIRLDEALGYLASCAYSFTSFVPDDIHYEAIESLKKETLSKSGRLDEEIEIPNRIYFIIITR